MKPYYEDQHVTLYHARWEDVPPDLLRADVLVTDPPYGMGYQHGARKGGVRLGFDEQSIVGDFEPFDPAPLLGLGLPTVMFGANHFASRLPDSRGWFVWDKRDGSPANDQSDAEMAWTNVLSVVRLFSARWSGAHRTGREQVEGRLHVNQKPVALMAWVLGYMPPGAVLDPFAGSGSTLVAAREVGRRSIGVEVDERHCETIARRLAQATLGLAA